MTRPGWHPNLPPKEECVDFLIRYGQFFGSPALRAKLGSPEATRHTLLHETPDLVVGAAYQTAKKKYAERK